MGLKMGLLGSVSGRGSSRGLAHRILPICTAKRPAHPTRFSNSTRGLGSIKEAQEHGNRHSVLACRGKGCREGVQGWG